MATHRRTHLIQCTRDSLKDDECDIDSQPFISLIGEKYLSKEAKSRQSSRELPHHELDCHEDESSDRGTGRFHDV